MNEQQIMTMIAGLTAQVRSLEQKLVEEPKDEALDYHWPWNSTAGDVPIGTVTYWIGNKSQIPNGWLVLDGSPYDPETYPELHVLLGEPPGVEYQKLPNLTKKFVLVADADGSHDPMSPVVGYGVGGNDQTFTIDEFQEVDLTHDHPLGTVREMTPSGAGSNYIEPTAGAVGDPILTGTPGNWIGNPAGATENNWDLRPPYYALYIIVKAK